MSDKLQTAREYILRKIESGELKGGDKLPAAREYSDEIGVSLAITQMAFTSLVPGRHSDQHSATGNLHPRRLAAADSAGQFPDLPPGLEERAGRPAARSGFRRSGYAINSGKALTRSYRPGRPSSGRRSISTWPGSSTSSIRTAATFSWRSSNPSTPAAASCTGFR